LADRAKQTRASRGLSIKDVSTQLKIPRYRLTAIEEGRLSEVKPEIALRYFQFLGIESWVKRWSRANLVLAKRVGIAHTNDKGQST
jgi:transcriptional regulator with XRE-family HTH domain